jgi:hypothetical protein
MRASKVTYDGLVSEPIYVNIYIYMYVIGPPMRASSRSPPTKATYEGLFAHSDHKIKPPMKVSFEGHL